MRYNEKELQALSRQPAEKAAEIGMRVPKKGSVVKRRLVKLVVNFLFYFRTDEAELEPERVSDQLPVTWTRSEPSWNLFESQTQYSSLCLQPIGALLLEHCRIAKEEPSGFSISFTEEPDRKYYFECSSEEQCQEWIDALRRASYEFMRRSLIFYRNEIQKMTGKDPLEQYGISEEARFQLNPH
ncbi:pleckstrin homology domain-containing family J member 1 isoform X2 [Monodelphis domestica]|uniref:pleckstrin homology domain-containing family J member 1 isoform X2 n=1 Tax=Monodelphis domestica TaxID=13616 RepID=UPI00044319FB|nr:pleckstrin homology domain-containing family J member 1 isoform X2 [Monodelphis domestica]